MLDTVRILELNKPSGVTYTVYLEENNTYRLDTTKLVSPWSPEELDDIIQGKNEKRKTNSDGTYYKVCSDAWETTQTYCSSLSAVIQRLLEESPELTELYPTVFSDKHRMELRHLIDLSNENGPNKSHWIRELTR